MPLLGFSKLLPKLLDGSKLQTIRKPRKHLIKEGDTLYIYWKLRTKQCRKLGEGIVTSKIPRCLGDFTIYDIKKDGFESREQFEEVFLKMHPDATPYTLFDIITWRWTKRCLKNELSWKVS